MNPITYVSRLALLAYLAFTSVRLNNAKILRLFCRLLRLSNNFVSALIGKIYVINYIVKQDEKGLRERVQP